jgi:hypothetical protein
MMSRSSGAFHGTIHARISDDQGKGFSHSTQQEAGETIAAQCMPNWQVYA